ncbi:DNA-binding transcriptional regulator, GntR family [Paenibacillus sp. UNC496MF]|uniref:GntR family transcriptional regulator n=1 Tax=Paenibacillus sp. UNC496MF TaxID=1502753 RepID=UPI0008EC9272|nr:GntR family transcriptional regulator [Paenibacillus sp. UNC496MF]SFJ48459.1 DNA-binding transcriptional regulator, GntR family [Paenibacillus sp. UNC496MF]
MTITRKKGPLYLQIKKIVKDRILHGVYPLGGHIPPEPQLEKEFNVSKMTVRNAIRELAEEGYVAKKSGVGTIVLTNVSVSRLSKGKRFTELLVEEGHRLEKRMLSMTRARLEPGTELHGLLGPESIRIERLYVLDDRPYLHIRHEVAAALLPKAERDAGEPAFESLYDLLEEQGVVLDNFRDAFSVGMASAETASLLGIPPGSPLLVRQRRTYDLEGRLIEYSTGYYQTELQPYLVRYDA